MQIERSGMAGFYLYKYDKQDRIIEIKEDFHIVFINYNSNGTIKEINDDAGNLKKQFYFIYRYVSYEKE